MEHSQVLQQNSILRSARKGDINAIRKAWLRSWHESPFGLEIHSGVFYRYARPLIDHMLTISDIAVLCSPSDEDYIMAFIVYTNQDEISIVHFAYTKKVYRRMGALTYMIDKCITDPIMYTFQTNKTKLLADKFNATYNPFILMR